MSDVEIPLVVSNSDALSVADGDFDEEYDEIEYTAEDVEHEDDGAHAGPWPSPPPRVEDDTALISDYFIQHGAHREYHVPKRLIQHEAPKNMKVRDGHHIGDMIASRSGKTWEGLMYYHVSMVGGENISGSEESAPHVCFEPPDGSLDTDDLLWMRPIPATVMTHHIPLWKAAIDEKYASKPDKLKDVLCKYKKVLKWTADKLSGQRLDPKNFSVGNKGFVPLAAGVKLKSIRIAPDPVPRSGGGKAETSSHGTKLTSAISKSNKKNKNASSVAVDMQSDASDVTAIPDARVIRIGPVGTTSTYVLDGIIYATLMA